jgi:hypothetical protein
VRQLLKRASTGRSGWCAFLTNPLVAPFLLSIGFLGLLIEIKTPAFGLAGLAGIGALTLFFGSHLIVGLAGWEVMMLLAAGILLLLAEVFIFPGFGVAGVLGTLAIMASIFMSLIGSLPTTTDLMVASGVVGIVHLDGDVHRVSADPASFRRTAGRNAFFYAPRPVVKLATRPARNVMSWSASKERRSQTCGLLEQLCLEKKRWTLFPMDPGCPRVPGCASFSRTVIGL